MPPSKYVRRPLATSPFNKAPVDAPPAVIYEVNDYVSHDRYGLGTVTSVDGIISVTVNFGTQTRRMNLPNAALQRL
ncbi:MAG: hypothetical protein ACT4P1_07445 [Sporichthyaceae bacterium]